METEGGGWFSQLSCVFPEPLFLFFLSLFCLSSPSESLNWSTVPLFIILFYFCCTSNTKDDGQSRNTLTGCVKSNLLLFTGFLLMQGENTFSCFLFADLILIIFITSWSFYWASVWASLRKETQFFSFSYSQWGLTWPVRLFLPPGQLWE